MAFPINAKYESALGVTMLVVSSVDIWGVLIVPVDMQL